MKSLHYIIMLAATSVIILSGCDKIVGNGKQGDNAPAEEEVYSQNYLWDILEDQELLVEQIREAKSSGDMATLKSLLSEFEVEELHFKAELETAKGSLSSAEATEISRRHREIIKKLN